MNKTGTGNFVENQQLKNIYFKDSTVIHALDEGKQGKTFNRKQFRCVCLDIIPVSNNPALLKAEKIALYGKFEMTDLGEIHYLLGMSIKRDRESRTLTISQPNYLNKVLKKFGMENCKPVSTPLEPGRKFQQL